MSRFSYLYIWVVGLSWIWQMYGNFMVVVVVGAKYYQNKTSQNKSAKIERVILLPSDNINN